jgi:hypothetical protein
VQAGAAMPIPTSNARQSASLENLGSGACEAENVVARKREALGERFNKPQEASRFSQGRLHIAIDREAPDR